MSAFKIGEILIGQNLIFETQCNGMECEIIGGLSLRRWENRATKEIGMSPLYLVRWADGIISAQAPHELRRRKPPPSDSHERTYMQKWRDMAGKAPQPVGVPA